MEAITNWWWSLPHKEIEGTLSTVMLVMCLIYIIYAVTGLSSISRRHADGTPDNSRFYIRNKIMMICCIILCGVNLLRVPFSVSSSESFWIGLLPLFLVLIWGFACFSLLLSRRQMQKLDTQLEEVRAALNRIENRTYTATIRRDVWPPDPE